MRSVGFSLFFGFLAIVGAACSGPVRNAGTPSDIAAIIADDTLTVDHVWSAFRRYGERDSTKAGVQSYLDQYLNYRIKVHAAREAGYDKDSAHVAELDQYRLNLGRDYVVEQEIVRPLVQQWIDRSSEQFFVRHILVRVETNATPEDTLAAFNKISEARETILAGEDFQSVARRTSEDASVVNNGGEIAVPIVAGDYVYAFENIVFETPVGDVSRIARSKRYGYHLVQVLRKMVRPKAIRLSQILIVPESETPEDSLAAWQEIQTHYQSLLEGADFSDLSSSVSDNETVRANRGDFGQTIESGILVAPLDSIAFSIEKVGDVTKPFKTPFGYHILKLTDRLEENAFDVRYEEIKKRILTPPTSSTPLERFEVRRKAVIDQAKREVAIVRNTEVFETAINQYHPDSLLTAMQPTGTFNRTHGSKIWATLDGYPITLKDVAARAIRERPTPGRPALKIVLDASEAVIDDGILTAWGRTLDKRDGRFRALMNEYEDGILMFSYSQDKIWDVASSDSVGLQQHYAANKNAYRFPRRLRVVTFLSAADSSLSVLKGEISAGKSLDVLKQTYESVPGFTVEQVMLTDSTFTPYDKAFGLAKGEFTEYPQYQQGTVVLVSGGWEAPRQKTFAEAKAVVISDYQKVVEARLISELKKRYSVRTYPENLNSRSPGPR